MLFRSSGRASEDIPGMIRDARVVTLVMTLLLIAAVYWAGFAIGGILPAVFAGLCCAAMPALTGAGCFALDVPIDLAWSMLAIASALWAIRPLRPSATLWRQALGWSVCGASLGMLLLSAGPSSLVYVLTPMLLIVLIVPHRLSHALGLLAAGIVALLLITPWATYVLTQDPEAWRVWLSQMNPPRSAELGEVWRLAGHRIGLILLLMLPWTLWLPAAVAQPMSTSSSGSRQRMFIGWTWFVSVGLLLLFAAGTQDPVQLLMLLPITAILFGQLFRQFTDLSTEGRHARLWRVLRWPHMILVVAAAVLIPVAMYFQDWFVTHGWIDQAPAATMHWAYWLVAGLVLFALAAVGAQFAWKHYPARAMVAWSVWTVAAMTLIAIPVTEDSTGRNPLEEDARSIVERVGDGQLYRFLEIPRSPDDHLIPTIVSLHAHQQITTLAVEQFKGLSASPRPVFILASTGERAPAGVMNIERYHGLGLELWRLQPAAAPDDTMPAAAISTNIEPAADPLTVK